MRRAYSGIVLLIIFAAGCRQWSPIDTLPLTEEDLPITVDDLPQGWFSISAQNTGNWGTTRALLLEFVVPLPEHLISHFEMAHYRNEEIAALAYDEYEGTAFYSLPQWRNQL